MSDVINTMLMNRTYKAGVVFLVLWERMQAQRGCGVCPGTPAWEGSWKCSPEHLSKLAPSPSVPAPVVPPDRTSSSKADPSSKIQLKFTFSSKFPLSILHTPSRELGLQSWFCHSLAVCPQGTCLSSLNLFPHQ